jgi:hypothetical protein
MQRSRRRVKGSKVEVILAAAAAIRLYAENADLDSRQRRDRVWRAWQPIRRAGVWAENIHFCAPRRGAVLPLAR